MIISGATSATYSATTSGSYTCVITNGACSSTTSAAILNTTSAPVGDSSQSLVAGSTLNSIIITGTNIQWYSSSTSTTPLADTTFLVNGTTYYASQTINGCEGPRLAVTVNLELGIDQNQFLKISYNPNPVLNILNIKSNETIKNISIYNSLGQLLFNQDKSENEFSIDFTNYATGNYFIKVVSENGKQIFKVVRK